MTLYEIKKELNSDKYSFLKENEHLGDNIILLGLGGSYAYGTNVETSDLDVRGIALNKKQDILTNQHFEQVINEETDTTIYAFNKFMMLLTNANPNIIELLGLKPEHYLYLSPIGQELLNNKKMFLSKKAVHSFGGYANQQLYRLNQKCAKHMSQAELETHILKTLEFMQTNFVEKYTPMNSNDYIKLYTGKSAQEGFDTEIFMDVNLTNYPLRDYCGMWSEMQTTVKSYAKVGKRNKNAMDHNKITKHMMHLIRLYLMCLDILEKEEINTYRENEHDLLMDIRDGKYVDEGDDPTSEFFEMVNEFEERLDYAKENTSLPKKPDYKKINDFTMYVNEQVVLGNL